MVKGTGSSSLAASDICPTCSLPGELCVCDTISSEGTPLRVRVDTRRYGKAVTVIEGFEDDDQAKSLGKELKRKLATGGTAKDRHVELQGEHVKQAKAFLQGRGYFVD